MDKPKRELIFAVTADDCRWDYFRGSGDGGQKKQKTSSACRCTHKESGAVGKSSDGRSQWQNKKAAFRKMTETKEFRMWVKLETSRRLRDSAEEEREKARIERYIKEAMKPENIKTQITEDGKHWIDTTQEYWISQV